MTPLLQPTQDLVQKYQIRRIKNYLLLHFRPLSLHLWIYARGGFKLTIGTSKHTKRLLTDLDRTMDKVSRILEQFFIDRATRRYDVGITQLLVSFHPAQTPNCKLTYPLLVSKLRPVNNRLSYQVSQGLEISHIVNPYVVENGPSSFSFSLMSNGERLADIRLFNNFKGLAFLCKIEDFPTVSTAFEQFVAVLMS